MRTRFIVGFNFERHQIPSAKELFLRFGRADLAHAEKSQFGYTLTFTQEADLVAFEAEAARLGLEQGISKRVDYLYTRREIVSAPLLALSVRTSEKGFGGPTYGTVYDLSQACSVCGTGAVQLSPLLLKRSDTPKSGEIFQTIDGETLLSTRLANAFREVGVSGVELREAIAHTDHGPLGWHQVITQFELPRMATQTSGLERENSCPSCGRDGYFHSTKPLQIWYEERAVPVDTLPDIVHTYERLGKSVLSQPFSDSHLAAPMLIVKQKVFLLCESLRIRKLSFEPVRICS